MFTKRIIPCLDVNAGRVVKGVNFVDLKDAGALRRPWRRCVSAGGRRGKNEPSCDKHKK